MRKQSKLNAILDANVIYPAPIRDLLLNLAEQELYNPKWSKIIEDEWIRNLLKNRPDLKRARLNKTVKVMNQAFPNAMVNSFEKLIETIELPDADDRHVVAAAIKSESKVIITSNIKDFPAKKLAEFEIEILTPDNFIVGLTKIDKDLVIKALKNQLASLKNPPMSKEDLINTLKKCGLNKSLKIFK